MLITGSLERVYPSKYVGIQGFIEPFSQIELTNFLSARNRHKWYVYTMAIFGKY